MDSVDLYSVDTYVARVYRTTSRFQYCTLRHTTHPLFGVVSMDMHVPRSVSFKEHLLYRYK